MYLEEIKKNFEKRCKRSKLIDNLEGECSVSEEPKAEHSKSLPSEELV